MITEPDVVFTDYGLAIECVLFSCLLYRRGSRQQPLRPRDHRPGDNALYHSIQAVAMFMIFYGAQWLMGSVHRNLHCEP